MLWRLLVVYLGSIVLALDNGLARTPPMGWMSWTAFFCEMDCVNHPKSCINEDLYKEMADALVKGGYRDAGYVSVHVDDCWMERERDRTTNRLVANRTRFPNGMLYLAKYMHANGLKFGIYEDFGTKTCAGFPGSLGYLELDALTFADWEVDYLKLDGCYVDTALMPKGYAAMERALNSTGRPIVYSCSWPAYLIDKPDKVDYNLIAKSCNLWRNFDDIRSSWKSILSIIDYYDHHQDKHIPTHGPGHWHDPDMVTAPLALCFIGNYPSTDLYMPPGPHTLPVVYIWDCSWNPMGKAGNVLGHESFVEGLICYETESVRTKEKLVIGNPGITEDMAIAQMTVWSIWSAPLIMSNDLRTLHPQFQKILLNRDVIAVDQDPMGRMGRLVANVTGVSAYVKPVIPVYGSDTSFALGFLNRNNETNEVEFKLFNLGLTNERGYYLKDLWYPNPIVKLSPNDSIRFLVPATGAAMYRAELVKPDQWLDNGYLPHHMLTNRNNIFGGIEHTMVDNVACKGPEEGEIAETSTVILYSVVSSWMT